MLLQSISLENFRQFVDEKIDFSTDAERNVTLIIGENGTGKTTFAQAFFWCLYGETNFSDKILLNRAVADRLQPDKKATVRVELSLTHGHIGYVVTRTQEYKKGYNGKVTGANTVLSIAVKYADGNTKYLKPLECETEIQTILPKALSTYFFFDGERIEKMSKEISGGKKSSGFAEAVEGLTGLKAMLAAIDHLKPTKTTSVMGLFDKEYSANSNEQVAKLTKEIERLQAELNKIESRLEEIEDEIESARTSKAKYEEEIKRYADGEKLQYEREKLTKQLLSVQKTRSLLIKDLCTSFHKGLPEFLAAPMVTRAVSALSQSDFSGKDIPEMHSKTIQYLLDRGTCICGTCLSENSIPYNKLMELLNYLPPQSIGVTVGQFIKETKSRYGNGITLYGDLTEALAAVHSQDDTIADLQQDIDSISELLDGEDVRAQVRQLNQQIKACSQVIASRTSEQKSLLISKGTAETHKAMKESQRSELALLDGKNRRIELYKAYTRRVYDELYAEYKERETEIRTRLQTLINEIFQFIYNGGLELEIDEKYNITVKVTDVIGSVETSTAQSISVIFAFISAIIKMARQNQLENGETSYSEPYPLVMDAPLSAFDKRRIEAICKALPETAEQVIIFIKDTDGELAESHLGSKVMKRHYFEKIDEFHTRLV